MLHLFMLEGQHCTDKQHLLVEFLGQCHDVETGAPTLMCLNIGHLKSSV